MTVMPDTRLKADVVERRCFYDERLAATIVLALFIAPGIQEDRS